MRNLTPKDIQVLGKYDQLPDLPSTKMDKDAKWTLKFVFAFIGFAVFCMFGTMFFGAKFVAGVFLIPIIFIFLILVARKERLDPIFKRLGFNNNEVREQ